MRAVRPHIGTVRPHSEVLATRRSVDFFFFSGATCAFHSSKTSRSMRVDAGVPLQVELLHSFAFSQTVQPGVTARPSTAVFEDSIRREALSTLGRAGLATLSPSSHGHSASPSTRTRSPEHSRSPSPLRSLRGKSLRRSAAAAAAIAALPLSAERSSALMAKQIASVKERRWSPFRAERKFSVARAASGLRDGAAETEKEKAPLSPDASAARRAPMLQFDSGLDLYTLDEDDGALPSPSPKSINRREVMHAKPVASPFWHPVESQSVLDVDNWLESYARERSHFRSNAMWADTKLAEALSISRSRFAGGVSPQAKRTLTHGAASVDDAPNRVVTAVAVAELIDIAVSGVQDYRYISCESFSQFDSLPRYILSRSCGA